MKVNWESHDDAESAARAAGRHIADLLKVVEGPVATLAVSGGSATKHMFQELAAANLDWSKVHVFWVDERPVPPDHADSNFKLANQYLLQPAGIPADNVHRIKAELPTEEAAEQYQDEIRRFFRLGDNELPRFDVVHLGMGGDGHTASLFPGETLIKDRDHIAASVYVDKMQQARITLLPAVLLRAKNPVMLVTQEDKAPMLQRVFSEPYQPEKFPAQLIAYEAPETFWYLDNGAARLLRPEE